jgi:hypothetical protein
MTAWGLGYRADEIRSYDSGSGSKLGGFVNRVVEWIPADVVALYAAAVTYLEESDGNPSRGWLYVFMAVTPLFSWLGVLAAKKTFTWQSLVAGVLALGAFAIWSASVPNSGWWDIDAVAENPRNVAIAAALGGALFGLIASIIDDRVPSTPIFKKKS